MSHYTPMHARDGQRRDARRARARDTWTLIRLIPLIPMIVRRARTRAAGSPAPAEAPVQEKPRPADPPPYVADIGVVRAGATPRSPGDRGGRTGANPGDNPPPAAALPATPSGESAATLPRPVPGPPAGRAGAARPAWVIFPDDRAALMQAGQVTINGLHARHRPPATEPIRISVVRPYYPAVEARRDSTARWGA